MDSARSRNDCSRLAMSASFCTSFCSNCRFTSASSGAARDSVSLISVLHCGHTTVGSAMKDSSSCSSFVMCSFWDESNQIRPKCKGTRASDWNVAVVQRRRVASELFAFAHHLIDQFLHRLHVHPVWIPHLQIFDAVFTAHERIYIVFRNVGTEGINTSGVFSVALQGDLTVTREQPVNENLCAIGMSGFVHQQISPANGVQSRR